MAVSTFTETFNVDDSNWLDAATGTPTYNATGGVGNTGFISYTPPDFNSGPGGFGDPLALWFRGNNANDASGDAFVGNWIVDGVVSLSLDVRHNYTTSLNFYARIGGGFPGAGASMANDASFAVAPNTWTTITIPIVDSNPPFVSYGAAGTFGALFSNVQDLQFGFYLPANTEISGLEMGIDNVGVLVPEPSTALLVGLGLTALGVQRRKRSA